MKHYLIITETDQWSVSCKGRLIAELWAFWLGLRSYIRLNPSRVHIMEMNPEFAHMADEMAKELRGQLK